MDSLPVLPPAVAALGISFDGRAYHYRDYSYERLGDALDYARLDQARPGFRPDAPPHRWVQWAGPTPEEQRQMDEHGIVYERSQYWYGPYRYDVLSAALEYAKHAPGLSRPARREEK